MELNPMIWFLYGTTPASAGNATFDSDSRCASSILLCVQVNFNGDWYNFSTDNGMTAVGQNADGSVNLYLTGNIDIMWFSKQCRAVMALI